MSAHGPEYGTVLCHKAMDEIETMLANEPLSVKAQAALLAAYSEALQYVPANQKDSAAQVLESILCDHTDGEAIARNCAMFVLA